MLYRWGQGASLKEFARGKPPPVREQKTGNKQALLPRNQHFGSQVCPSMSGLTAQIQLPYQAGLSPIAICLHQKYWRPLYIKLKDLIKQNASTGSFSQCLWKIIKKNTTSKWLEQKDSKIYNNQHHQDWAKMLRCLNIVCTSACCLQQDW